jgi:hypothetical protein
MKVHGEQESGQQLVKRYRVKIHYGDVGPLGYKGVRIGQTTNTQAVIARWRPNMGSTKEIVKKAISDNPEIAAVLEIAARAREVEERTPPQEIRASTDVSALPTHTQNATEHLGIPVILGSLTQTV